MACFLEFIVLETKTSHFCGFGIDLECPVKTYKVSIMIITKGPSALGKINKSSAKAKKLSFIVSHLG